MKSRGPVLIELEEEGASPAEAPPVPDTGLPEPQGAAMQSAARLTARRSSRLGRWAWSLALAIVGFVVSVGFWQFVTDLIARAPLLGYAATALIAAFVAVLLLLGFREWLAIVRLRKVDRFQSRADSALAQGDLAAARSLSAELAAFYTGRADLRWGLTRLAERQGEAFDADAVLAETERELLTTLDEQAAREVEAAARQVATVTAIVPLALADVATALAANLRMIRRIAEIYGGRAGVFGGWRLTKAVMTHLVATGAVAVGDDLIGSVAGGSLLSRVSRRFGEGVVNGALTARVGVAAMEVCRPLPFHALKRPSVTAMVKRALSGLFGAAD